MQTLPFTKIRILSSNRSTVRPEHLDKEVELISDKNQGLDFGLWFRELQGPREEEYKEATNILLCNDSCSIQYPLLGTYQRMKHHEFWGITSSIDIDLHIQSYFLCFGPRAVQALLDFVKTCKPADNCSKYELILRREIALSQYLITKNFYPAAAFPYNLINPESSLTSNSSYFSWVNLKLLGCPLLKNSRNMLPKLISARYGTSTRSLCVLERLRECWNAGMMITVSPKYLLCDPSLHEPKFLTVIWENSTAQQERKVYQEGTSIEPWKV